MAQRLAISPLSRNRTASSGRRPRHSAASPARVKTSGAMHCRRKFLRFYPGGFIDDDYISLERAYKLTAHQQWTKLLGRRHFGSMIAAGEFKEIAAQAVRIESRTNLIFSFEKMALRDAVKSSAGARAFALGLYDFLHGRGGPERRFDRWCEVVASLPRKQTRVLTWPIVTVFGFVAQPDTHVFFKPNVTKQAAREYGFEFPYASRPNWQTYNNLLRFSDTIRRDLRDLRPRDMIDIQSFIWVQGSDEYEE